MEETSSGAFQTALYFCDLSVTNKVGYSKPAKLILYIFVHIFYIFVQYLKTITIFAASNY